MYRKVEIAVGDPKHTGKDNFKEVQILLDGKLVETVTGPKANILARDYIVNHAWQQGVAAA